MVLTIDRVDRMSGTAVKLDYPMILMGHDVEGKVNRPYRIKTWLEITVPDVTVLLSMKAPLKLSGERER